MAALLEPSSGERFASKGSKLLLWPQGDLLRLVQLLDAREMAPASAACKTAREHLQVPIRHIRDVAADSAEQAHVLDMNLAVEALDELVDQARQVTGASKDDCLWQSSWEKLRKLETSLYMEMRYVYGLDWEMKPGKLVSKKGTWMKTNTCFSWELKDGEKLYLPQGVVMPVMQIGKVVDDMELKRHDWVVQHLRVWMKPAIVHTLEARRNVWFVYFPHWDGTGLAITALADTWLKRTTQMSGDLQPFELVYVPKGLPMHIVQPPSPVDEEWEKFRHQHVHMHRKVVLTAPPLTVKQDQYDIFVGQGGSKAVLGFR
mmetsp:Transcript_1270/g.2343  ORF Transcript_1270/g.2343 Transcript_1270/m.2343 type:complete len:316 (+) Transcript_1270:56-1003(+)